MLLIDTDITATGESLLDVYAYDATDEGDKYMQAATDGGYTVNDETWLRRLIAGLISINAWSCWGHLGCGAGGYKDFLTNQPKLLSLRGPNNTPTVVSSSPTVGGSGTKPYINIPDDGCFFDYSFVPRVGAEMGCIIQDAAAAVGSVGCGLQFTAGSALHRFYIGDGSFYVAPGLQASGVTGNAQIKGPSTFGFAANDVATWALDFDAQTATLYKNGVQNKSICGIVAAYSGGVARAVAGATQTVRLTAIGAPNVRPAVWGTANVPVDMQAIGALVASL